MGKKYAFDPLIEAIITARSSEALTKALETFCEAHGFSYFAYLRLDGNRWCAVSNYSDVWKNRYDQQNYSVVDPIVRAAKRGAQPFCWSLDDRIFAEERPEVIAFRDDAIDHNIRAGFSIPIRVGFSHQAILTFASSDNFCLRSAVMMDVVQAAATAAMLHLAFSTPRTCFFHARRSNLTPFELTCLRWIAEGKTMQDVAELLDEKYSRVRVSIDRARAKLDAVTVQQATARATRMMLI